MGKLIEILDGPVGSILRKALVAAGTYVVSTGAVSDVQWENFVAGAVPVILGTVWSLIGRKKP